MIPFPYKNYRIILDTCFISDFCSRDENIRNQVLKLCLDLAGNDNLLYYSNVSLFELINNLKKIEEQILIEKLKPFLRYVISETVLLKSSRLKAIYKSQGIDLGNDICDLLIASTAINDGSYMHFIITSNGKHFPKPFFREYHREYLYYGTNSKNHGRVKAIHYLFPDMVAINSELNNLGMGNWGDVELIPDTLLASQIQSTNTEETKNTVN